MMQLLVEKLHTIEFPSFDFWYGQLNNLEKGEVMLTSTEGKYTHWYVKHGNAGAAQETG